MEPVKGSRVLGGTEQSWSRAVPGGTGTAVLAILTTKSPNSAALQTALHTLQTNHPILRSRLNNSSSPATIITADKPFVAVTEYNLLHTLNILENNNNNKFNPSPLQLILEHELNNNKFNSSLNDDLEDMLFATTYALPQEKWAMVLRLHVAACDRTTAVSLLKELLMLVGPKDQEETMSSWVEVCRGAGLEIEKLIPGGKNKKSMWARGVNMVGYSLGSSRLTNLKFVDAKSPRRSRVVRLQLDHDQTRKLLDGCEKAGIKLCGALTAAGMIAVAHSMRKNVNYNGGADNKQRKFGVVTLTDCRPILKPSLSPHHFGFYHSAIMNTHVLKTTPHKLFEVAQKAYAAFKSYKDSHRQFTDMADINFLMTTALDNPSLTPSSALRTSLMSVFEDTVVDNSSNSGSDRDEVGVVDYMGCASVHGIGPSIAVFDTVREGKLDCVCVYPSPLHSREQMEEFVEKMKSVLISG